MLQTLRIPWNGTDFACLEVRRYLKHGNRPVELDFLSLNKMSMSSHASRSLTSPEWQYSTIQRECAAIKQFRHYLLGRHFKILTDHAPLQRLSAQNMEGMLCRRALVLQEYDFDIDFWKGKQNVNADALSRRYSPCAITQVESHLPLTEIRTSQQSDSTLSQVLQACQQPESPICNSRWDDIDNSGLKLNWLMTFSVENIHQVLSRRK